MQLKTTKLLPETIRLAKQQAAARGMFMYEYLDKLVKLDIVSSEVSRMGESDGIYDGVYILDINTGQLKKIDNQ